MKCFADQWFMAHCTSVTTECKYMYEAAYIFFLLCLVILTGCNELATQEIIEKDKNCD